MRFSIFVCLRQSKLSELCAKKLRPLERASIIRPAAASSVDPARLIHHQKRENETLERKAVAGLEGGKNLPAELLCYRKAFTYSSFRVDRLSKSPHSLPSPSLVLYSTEGVSFPPRDIFLTSRLGSFRDGNGYPLPPTNTQPVSTFGSYLRHNKRGVGRPPPPPPSVYTGTGKRARPTRSRRGG